MSYRSLAARRKFAGLAGTLLICLCLALALDGMIAGGRKDPTLHDLLPGETLNLTDPMPRGAEKLADLRLETDNPHIGVRMLETFSGFWLGGTLWRAEVTIPADAEPGTYAALMRYAANGTETAPRQSYRLRVHKDAAGIQASALSLTKRAFGVSPYVLAACLLPLAVIPMAVSFVITRRLGQALCAEGMAEIYRAMASPEGQRIFFTLPGCPFTPGARVLVLDERGDRQLGTALVDKVTGDNAEALMQEGASVRPGALAKPV